jgi:hypothetical protein
MVCKKGVNIVDSIFQFYSFLGIEVTIIEEQRSTRKGSKNVSTLLAPIFLIMLLFQEFLHLFHFELHGNSISLAYLSCRIEVSTTSTELVLRLFD